MSRPRKNLIRWASGCMLIALVSGCGGLGYYYIGGPLLPISEQQPDMTVADDRGVTYALGRLEVRLRPVTEDELNRQFASVSGSGQKSTNPYTFGDTEFDDGPSPSRFTVFHLSVKNYAYPKVVVDPARVELVTTNRRQYWSLNLQQLETYHRTYAIGFRGNEYERYQERLDLLRRTMFKSDAIFSGQESEGFVLFPSLHDDVTGVEVIIHDAALRFDFHGEPVESIDIPYAFERTVDKIFGAMPNRGA